MSEKDEREPDSDQKLLESDHGSPQKIGVFELDEEKVAYITVNTLYSPPEEAGVSKCFIDPDNLKSSA